MPCTINGVLQSYSASNTGVGSANQQILAVPDLNTRRFSLSGTYLYLAVSPLITTAAYQYGRTTQTDGSGNFTFVLPRQDESKPTSPVTVWNIVLPDGRILSGNVPNMNGPLTLDDLESTYGWVWNTKIYFAPVTPGTFWKGSIPFTVQSTASVVFGPAYSFASNQYQIGLNPSVDSGTGNIPSCGWSAKTTTGFVINVEGVFTGTVDAWAQL